VVDRPLNFDQPPDVPVRPAAGRLLVIARLVWPGAVELVPGLANRWTRTHVLVTRSVRDAEGRATEELLWLPAGDVRRSIRTPAPP
jgi:hypothetical protein